MHYNNEQTKDTCSGTAQQAEKFYHDPNRLPKGRYDAVIVKAFPEFRDEHGYYKVRLDLEIMSDGRRGQPEHKEYHLKSKKALAFMRNEFEKLGVAVSGSGDLNSACNAIKGRDVSITVDYLPNGNRAIYVSAARTGQPSKQGTYEHIWD